MNFMMFVMRLCCLLLSLLSLYWLLLSLVLLSLYELFLGGDFGFRVVGFLHVISV